MDLRWVWLVVLAAGCIDEEKFQYAWDDRRVLCSSPIDDLIHDATLQELPGKGFPHGQRLTAKQIGVEDGRVGNRLDRPECVCHGAAGEHRRQQRGQQERSQFHHVISQNQST